MVTNKLRIGEPFQFTGNPNDYESFIQAVNLYLLVNKDIYDSNPKKIGFILSYMQKGPAAGWKSQYIQERTTDGTLDLTGARAYNDFRTAQRKSFEPTMKATHALDRIKTLTQGSNSAENHVVLFKALALKSGITDEKAVIDCFQGTLNRNLLKKLLELPTPPEKLSDWYDWAIRLDQNYRRILTNLARFSHGRSNKPTPTTTPVPCTFNFPKSRPPPQRMEWDMSIDTLTTGERDRLRRIGGCFKCRKTGHIARECPTRNNSISPTRPTRITSTAERLPTTGKALLVLLMEAYDRLDPFEQKEFDKSMEEQPKDFH